MTEKKIRVAVAGASGYAGGEVLRLLLAAPARRDRRADRRVSAGSRLVEHQPHLMPLHDRVLEPTDAQTLSGHDVVFLGLPHGHSGAVAATLGDDALVVDLGADHRVRPRMDWADYYGGDHAGTWPYGLPRAAHRRRPPARRAARRRAIAVPGCNVTAVTAGAAAAFRAGLVQPTDLVAVLANGFSGAGKAAKPHLLASEGLGSASAYGVGGAHRHNPEIVQNLRSAGADEVSISFTPTLVPMARGILPRPPRPDRRRRGRPRPRTRRLRRRAVRAPAARGRLADDGRRARLEQRVRPGRRRRARGRLVTVTAIDNLVKGTAGGAIQSMNLALACPRPAGLPDRRSGSNELHPPDPLAVLARLWGPRMSVTAAQGFRANGVAAGLKSSGDPDVAVVVNDGPARPPRPSTRPTAARPTPCCGARRRSGPAGVRRRAELRRRQLLQPNRAEGFQTTHATAELVADRLGVGAIDVQVCSTGLIGLGTTETTCSAASPPRSTACPPTGEPRPARPS